MILYKPWPPGWNYGGVAEMNSYFEEQYDEKFVIIQFPWPCYDQKEYDSCNFRNNKCVISKDNGKMYIVHMGRRMIHPLRRFLKNNYEYANRYDMYAGESPAANMLASARGLAKFGKPLANRGTGFISESTWDTLHSEPIAVMDY